MRESRCHDKCIKWMKIYHRVTPFNKITHYWMVYINENNCTKLLYAYKDEMLKTIWNKKLKVKDVARKKKKEEKNDIYFRTIGLR